VITRSHKLSGYIRMTGRRRKVLVSIILALTLVAVGTYASNWYNTRVRWPARIQRELLGHEIAYHRSLIRYDRFVHFGQGAFTWSYRFVLPAHAATDFCNGQPSETCHFERRGRPQPQVETSILDDSGQLTIEESWL